MSLKDALKKLDDTLEDLSSLEVHTYVGDIEVNTEGQLGDFEAYIKKHGVANGKIKLVAVTKMMCDGDAVNLIPEKAFPDHIQRVHDAAVKAGIETRHGLLSLFGGMAGLTTKQ
ncbi:hypothetical protein [Mariprofundus ferrooxydans]|uniref:Uncharacterized protein n=1 Tax=Mariprofundus ferrooxydans PV-1 TaxID=314345 RepID=Q0F2Z4_9PROT|nr:hypothetical protein [Mariprofundus ferrooxydans]EAU56147.1 hypothetical protein SPV1_04983 [Mariprofundus ferrooxydans PV-1]KON48082.1 hypothetical protein AL013_04860 [Mariprofundus ferrooxydans]